MSACNKKEGERHETSPLYTAARRAAAGKGGWVGGGGALLRAGWLLSCCSFDFDFDFDLDPLGLSMDLLGMAWIGFGSARFLVWLGVSRLVWPG